MVEEILKIPSQIVEGYKLAKDINVSKAGHVIVCGMGGSAIVGQMAEMLSSKVSVHYNFDLPAVIPEGSLIICISWSGETEETISALQSAHQNNLPAIAITKHGKLAEKAKEYGFETVVMPDMDIKPRLAVGLVFGALISILEKTSIIEKQNLQIIADQAILKERANQLAQLVGEKIPLIYTSEKWKNLGEFWKAFFNENSKTEASSNWVPKLDHNELASLTEKDKNKFAVILMEEKADDDRIKDAIERIDAMLEGIGYTHDMVDIEGDGMIEKIFRNYVLAGLTTAFLAQNKGVDPKEAPVIDRFKKI